MEKFNAKILMLEERISQFKTEEERRRFFLENPEEVYKEMKHKIEEGQLKSITIPFYMQRIVESAFKECKSLEKIEIPSSVTYILSLLSVI